jgi:E3 ubiquitin-protein ligase HUWE1
MVWYSVLDRFDDILGQMIKEYHSDDLQMTPFTPSDKELIMQILRFERMLLDNSTTRKLFNSYDVSKRGFGDYYISAEVFLTLSSA